MSVNMIKQFHFIDPQWLWALIPAVLLIGLIFKYHSSSHSAWKNVIDAKFLPYLLVKQGASRRSTVPLILLAAGWIVAVLALANPSWKSLPQPVYQQPEAQVIVFNLSSSMLSRDVKPSRLVQARFKIEDLLRRSQGKQTGLIAYAGDAFTVTPLTDDIATIKSQLRVLEPSLMPVDGNRTDLALNQAGQLLQQAGFRQGNIILVTDNAGDNTSFSKAQSNASQLAKNGYQISVLSIGKEEGNKAATAALQSIARESHGIYAPFTGNQQDVKAVLNVAQHSTSRVYQNKIKNKQANRPVEEGPWLALLLLPLALLAFRRGWLLVVPVLLIGQLLTPQQAMAFSWDDLWQRPDQQAAAAFNKKDYQKAAHIAPDILMQGSAQYRAGQYKKAAESFSKNSDAQSAYNLGNALAHTGDYKQAIEAYDKALKQQPGMQDAIANRKLVAELLKQQQKKQQQQKKNNQGKNQQNKKGGNKNNKNNKKDKKGNKDNKKNNGNKNKSGNNSNKNHNDKGNKAQKQNHKKGKSSSDKSNNQSGKQDKKSANKKQKPGSSSQQAKKGQQQKPDFNKAGSKKEQKKANDAVKKAARKAAQKQASKNKAEKNTLAEANLKQDKLSPEERESVENWLRRVPDDPGGLLRRKFLYQYQQRQQY